MTAIEELRKVYQAAYSKHREDVPIFQMGLAAPGARRRPPTS